MSSILSLKKLITLPFLIILMFAILLPYLANNAYAQGYVARNSYQWTKSVGGPNNDYVEAVTTDSSGNVYAVGEFWETVDFDPGEGIDNHTSIGFRDFFLTKYDSSGAYQWTRTTGGSDFDGAKSVTTDSSGNVYITGHFWGTVDFDPGEGYDSHSSNGTYDLFLTKYDSSGAYQWTRTIGGTEGEIPTSITIDQEHNLYLAGNYSGTTDFDPGEGIDNHTGTLNNGTFLSKYNTSGEYQWTKTNEATQSIRINSATTDPIGNIYTTGNFTGTVDFDPGEGFDNVTGYGDVFLTKFDSAGSYQWTKTFGSLCCSDEGTAITTDSSGNIYLAGYFMRIVDFNPGTSVDNQMSKNIMGIFLSKYDASGEYQWTKTITTGNDNNYATTVKTDPSGNIYLSGRYGDTIDFDPGDGIENHTSNGNSDIFLSKYSALDDPPVFENRKPFLFPIGNMLIQENKNLTFSLNATDADDNSVTYSAANLPPGATFDPSTATFSWTPTSSQIGSYENVEFTATDNGSPIKLTTELITITVNPNQPPESIMFIPQTIDENNILTFQIQTYDYDGNDISVTASNLPEGSIFTTTDEIWANGKVIMGKFTWNLTDVQSGNYTVTFTATDDGTPSASSTLDVPITVIGSTPAEKAGIIMDTIENAAIPARVGKRRQEYN